MPLPMTPANAWSTAAKILSAPRFWIQNSDSHPRRPELPRSRSRRVLRKNLARRSRGAERKSPVNASTQGPPPIWVHPRPFAVPPPQPQRGCAIKPGVVRIAALPRVQATSHPQPRKRVVPLCPPGGCRGTRAKTVQATPGDELTPHNGYQCNRFDGARRRRDTERNFFSASPYLCGRTFFSQVLQARCGCMPGTTLGTTPFGVVAHPPLIPGVTPRTA